MFGFGKKKKPSLSELPPPPSPPGMELPKPASDFPPMPAQELPEFPTAPSREEPIEPFAGVDIPEAPAPELPEAPGVEVQEVPTFPEPPTMEEGISGHELEPAPEIAVFDRTIEEPREIVRKMPGSMFVSVDDYRVIMDHSERVRAKLADAEHFVHQLGEIKAEEEKVFDKWRSQLEDVERKLGQVDRIVAKAKR